MIYRSVNLQDDIRQGDIFINLPYIQTNLEELNLYKSENSFEKVSIENVEIKQGYILTSFEKKDYSIVLSQDCDCLRSPSISLFVIADWDKKVKNDKNWMKEILKLNNESPYRMYLPPESNFSINNRMFIDFSLIFYVVRKNLENLKKLRLCRLNNEALEHFREKMAYYFHRYAYTEYYPFNKKEIDKYEAFRGKKFQRRDYQK